ncbi:molybdopterin molybdotransferase MoeA [Leucobacter sp. Z1108]|uniref:molybdopterin molybdotransferase MoeA n=1 Tax=unclassified Leucobacter TaxID=2621730 RepID=UPI003D951527
MARSVAEHLVEVRALLAPVVARIEQDPPEFVRISDPDLLDRVTANALSSSFPLPPFDNSQMDGYAVRLEDIIGAHIEQPISLPLGVATAAGDPPLRHQPGTASPVMTGAAIPEGADTVIPVEHCQPASFPPLVRANDGNPSGEIHIVKTPPIGQFVRRQGEDLPSNSELVGAGVRLTPALIGSLASAGIVKIPVRRRLRVLLCATGDELSRAGETLSRGRIHDANTPMLAAALRATGAEVRTARLGDHKEDLYALLDHEAAGVDLLVTSGGISAGAFEVVREAFNPLGAQFVGVAMQPGGPQGLGTVAPPSGGPTVVALCFPGNPVSSFLSAELFLLPTLRRLAGRAPDRTRVLRTLAEDVHSPEHKLQLRRGRVLADGTVTVSPPGSHLLSDLAGADLIAEIPDGVAFAPAGSQVNTWSIHE